MALFTIGHSNHALDRFLALLAKRRIEVVVDVRSRPASRWCPHFNRRGLETALRQAGLEYRWRGEFLGGLGRVSVEAPGFVNAMEDLLQLSRRKQVVLMCKERDPRDCHRATKLSAWIHRHAPGRRAAHILSGAGPADAIDSRALESSLDPTQLWWELDPRAFGRSNG